MKAQLGARDHEGIPHIVARIPHISEFFPGQTSQMLTYRQEIGQKLGRMVLICQAVSDRDAGIAGELLNPGLLKTAVLDAVEHSSQHARRIADALLLSDL